MANIIIPPHHQSAPKTTPAAAPFVHTDRKAGECRFDNTRPAAGDFDSEFDLPEYHDPKIAAAVAEIERQDRIKPSEAMLEEAHRQFEKTACRMRDYRWQGQERWQGRESEEMRVVRIMHPHTFMRHLQHVGVRCLIEDACEWYRANRIDVLEWPRPQARFWLNSFSKAGRVGLSAFMPEKNAQGQETGRLTPQTVATLQYPYAPEFTVMRFNEYNVPTNEKFHGWRTTLLGLLMAKLVTEAEALRAFGPAEGAAASFYNQQLFWHRQVHIMGVRKSQPAEVA